MRYLEIECKGKNILGVGSIENKPLDTSDFYYVENKLKNFKDAESTIQIIIDLGDGVKIEKNYKNVKSLIENLRKLFIYINML